MDEKFKFDWIVVEPVPRKGAALGTPRPGRRRVGESVEGAILVAAPPPPPRVEPMTLREADEERRAGKVALIDMPLRLIRPKAKSDTTGRVQETPWGLADIKADGS